MDEERALYIFLGVVFIIWYIKGKSPEEMKKREKEREEERRQKENQDLYETMERIRKKYE